VAFFFFSHCSLEASPVQFNLSKNTSADKLQRIHVADLIQTFQLINMRGSLIKEMQSGFSQKVSPEG
jgi:hypothetical protein